MVSCGILWYLVVSCGIMVSCREGEVTEGAKQVLSRLEHHEDAVQLAVLQELLVVTVTERGRKRVRQCVFVCAFGCVFVCVCVCV
jgi:hypothetical protein